MNNTEIYSDWHEKYIRRLGLITLALSQSAHYRVFQFASIKAWILPAVCHGNEHVFVDPDLGYVEGFMTWACVDENTFKRLTTNSDYMLHPSEWNEGEHVVVLDFSTMPGCFISRLKKIKQSGLFDKYQSVHSIRRNHEGEILKIIKWK
ncbi:toxin-activating lysine-acyltransferase [Enterovibrio sp. ZSDZ35]|uniref:RTX toxin-activating lysine-acyltransferase n=1 Tax=Enterovibrio qingdaonensis TaxID=2899818 RepID=A0ABT5QKG9_9GAMM|nr:toxin-activating lysine-acyltransferase [Enterovibrio sp. ZSDZ35]MDD1780975.1 toxin-activating lysine-acyltransferase [Enterovibrio sp. ZSDZ35]